MFKWAMSYKPIPPQLNLVSKEIVDSAHAVHKTLGPGLLESVYEACLEHELNNRGLKLKRQVNLPVIYGGLKLDGGLRLDLVVEEAVIVEIKSVETVLPVHKAQILTYLKLSGQRLGLLLNFNVPRIKDGIYRFIL
jgi:GxxExxY protein